MKQLVIRKNGKIKAIINRDNIVDIYPYSKTGPKGEAEYSIKIGLVNGDIDTIYFDNEEMMYSALTKIACSLDDDSISLKSIY